MKRSDEDRAKDAELAAAAVTALAVGGWKAVHALVDAHNRPVRCPGCNGTDVDRVDGYRGKIRSCRYCVRGKVPPLSALRRQTDDR